MKDDASALMRLLKAAELEARGIRPADVVAGLPRITVFDPPKRRRRKVQQKRRFVESSPLQLKLL